MRTLSLLLLASLVPLAGCTVGPDYSGPPALLPPPEQASGFVRAGDAPLTNAAPQVARWWETLDDAVLTDLEQRALEGSPDVAVAQARLRQAQAGLRLQRAADLPNVSASATYVHARLPGIQLGDSADMQENTNAGDVSATDFYNLGFIASWEADLFGGQRRGVEAATAQLARAQADVADAQVSLTAAVAQTYINLRELQQRIGYLRAGNDLQRRELELMRQRFAQGTVSQIEIERLQTRIQDSTAQTLPLGAEAESYANALAVLTGQAPGTLDAMLTKEAPIPLPPASVAIGDPASLLQRRPDIRAAERRLAEQTARVGIAEAARLPSLNFLGILGIGGTDLGALSNLGDFTALAAPMLRWGLFDFGRGKARVGQAEGVRDEAEAQYRQTVLAALQDAEDSCRVSATVGKRSPVSPFRRRARSGSWT